MRHGVIMSSVLLAVWLLTAGPTSAQDASADTTLVNDLLTAQSTVDSLRIQIRRLDRDIQAMKQNLSDGGELESLLESLSEEEPVDASVPEDTRSRRRRVDALLRAISQRPGQLRFNGGTTLVVQDVVDGADNEAAGSGTLDLFASTSFGPSTLLFFAFEAGGGEGLMGVLPTATPLNGDAVSTRSTDGLDLLVLNEAWAEFTALDEAVTLTVGKLDLTNYVDINRIANDETAQFLAGAFVNSAALLAPSPGPALRARTVLVRRFSVQGAIASADSTGGTRFRDVFAVASVGMRLFPDSDREGNVHGYFYAPPGVGGARGWGVSVDQDIGGPVAVFGRYGHNEQRIAAAGGIDWAWSAGLQWQGSLRGRQLVLAAAYGVTETDDSTSEDTVEVYGSLQLNTWTFASLHVQSVADEVVLPERATAIAGRIQFNF